MGDLQVAIGTGGLDPKKHGCCLDLRLATISLDKKQCQSDKKPKNLHYIFESGVPQSPAAPLQNLIVPKKIAAACRRWVRASSDLRRSSTSALTPSRHFAEFDRTSIIAKSVQTVQQAVVPRL